MTTLCILEIIRWGLILRPLVENFHLNLKSLWFPGLMWFHQCFLLSRRAPLLFFLLKPPTPSGPEIIILFVYRKSFRKFGPATRFSRSYPANMAATRRIWWRLKKEKRKRPGGWWMSDVNVSEEIASLAQSHSWMWKYVHGSNGKGHTVSLLALLTPLSGESFCVTVEGFSGRDLGFFGA